MRTALVVLGLVGILVAGATAGVPPYDLVKIHPSEAAFMRSIEVYQQALAANPRDADAQYWLGVAYWEASFRYRDGVIPYGKGYLDKAIAALERAVSIDDKHLAAWQLLAAAYPTRGAAAPPDAPPGMLLDDHDKGWRATEKAIALSEDLGVAYKGVPRARKRSGEVVITYPPAPPAPTGPAGPAVPTRKKYSPADFYVIGDEDTKIVYKYPCPSLPAIKRPAFFLTKWEAFDKGYKPATTVCPPP